MNLEVFDFERSMLWTRFVDHTQLRSLSQPSTSEILEILQYCASLPSIPILLQRFHTNRDKLPNVIFTLSHSTDSYSFLLLSTPRLTGSHNKATLVSSSL